MTESKFDFAGALRARQSTLIASLAEGRSAQSHPTASGDHSELDWRGTLRRFLPNRYRISHGSVVDASGETSDAIDVIVHDAQYTPTLFQREENDDNSIVVPAESVYAVFEAKPTLDKAYLEYSSKKVASVRRLDRTSSPITHAGGSYEPKPLHRIIGGILSDSCAWTPCLGEPFQAALLDLAEDSVIDLGCALEGGAFERLNYTEKDIELSPPDLTLMFFLVRLFGRLQEIGTAPAIDIESYAPSLFNASQQEP